MQPRIQLPVHALQVNAAPMVEPVMRPVVGLHDGTHDGTRDGTHDGIHDRTCAGNTI